jgi:hypothetical protein
MNQSYVPYVIVYLVTSLSKIPYTHCIYIGFWPTLHVWWSVNNLLGGEGGEAVLLDLVDLLFRKDVQH